MIDGRETLLGRIPADFDSVNVHSIAD